MRSPHGEDVASAAVSNHEVPPEGAKCGARRDVEACGGMKISWIWNKFPNRISQSSQIFVQNYNRNYN